MKQPNFFIVGAPKCGTTAMNDYLQSHPDVFMATKELHFFGKDLATKTKITRADYLQHFELASIEKIVGDASVWYLFSHTAAKEIHDFAPNAKILIMLRNPVEVIHSLHSQNLFDANEDVSDFEAALNLDEERKKGNNLPDSLEFTRLPPYLDSVLFSAQVNRYLEVFGSKNVQIVIYDDFVKDIAGVYAGVLQFLGVSVQPDADFRHINPNKKISSLALHRLIKNPKSGLKKWVRFLLPFKPARHWLMSVIQQRNVNFKKRPPMRQEVSDKLKKMLASEIRELERVTGRNLSAWL